MWAGRSVLSRNETTQTLYHPATRISPQKYDLVPRQCDECAIFFRRRFTAASSRPTPIVNGLRRASESTTTCLGSKYRKIGKWGILRDFTAFSGRKNENIGLLCHKVPMFCPKSTDVCLKEVRCFCPKTRHFLNFSPHFFSFLPRNPMNSPDISTTKTHTIDIFEWQNIRISTKIRSKRDTKHCQNF